ncbi:branched-chain amino acid ABC transporter permease [Vibrio penaeicida]|uniref:Branched-chain amino acid ABC transporter permease n=1 Tax=Vibrio penaeicida TaxID=104609 RepID=A0AAV5NXZ8_9VIBR|nr:branched-chain amino acid ABC transporter permease [Vibrio penaeicida]RTZ21466.1 branched-chain amino acid ABC transporter permease [Vibrio penaeicida]GLQ75154.1 branched-chain amino acid ABC transporter permease [Vibrio penaeicida]
MIRSNLLTWVSPLSSTSLNALLYLSLICIAIVAHLVGEVFLITLSTRVVIFALAGIGLNIALGYGGLVSLGHAAFFGLGGYSMGILASHAQDYMPLYEGVITVSGTQSMPIVWLVALISSGIAAFVIGLLSLRTSGVYFIMVTLAFGQMLYHFAISWSRYGGEDGLVIYTRNTFPGLDTLDPLQFFLITFVLLSVVLYFTARLRYSPFGMVLKAVRQAPGRVEAVGVHPFKIRLIAFVISGMITGLAGALYADLNRFVSPEMFSWQLSGEIMIFVILGGVGRLFGPVAGAGVFVFLEYLLGGLSDFWHIYLGAILLFVVLFAKGGIVSILSKKESVHE